jgi:ribosomal protein S18 acetylase RimI-like enzyme
MGWGESRARQAIPRCPAEAKVVQHVACDVRHQPSIDLFLERGFAYNRSFYTMRIDLTEAPPAPVLPKGILIRSARLPEELAKVVHTDRDGFRDHWGYVDSPFEEEFAHWKHEMETDSEFDASLWFVAVEEATGRFAGVNLCRSKGWNEPSLAWVSSLAVRREYRQQGLGLALLQHSFGEFWRRGLPNIGLVVDASNLTGALRLYERAGMSVYLQRNVYEKVLRDGVDMMTTQLSS